MISGKKRAREEKPNKSQIRRDKMTTIGKYTGKIEGKIAPITGGNSGNGLGIVDGRLVACPNKPNCVSSQAAGSDRQHYIDALTYSGEPAQGASGSN